MARRKPRDARFLGLWTAGWLAVFLVAGLLWVGDISRQWPVLARSIGSLFIRSYERGERVHLAMLSRGSTGRMPPT